jgi:hypothetical protein
MTRVPAKTETFGCVGLPTLDRPRSMNARDDAHEGMRAVHRTVARRAPPLLGIVYGNRP